MSRVGASLTLDEQRLIAWYRTRSSLDHLFIRAFVYAGRIDLLLAICQPLAENTHPSVSIPLAEHV